MIFPISLFGYVPITNLLKDDDEQAAVIGEVKPQISPRMCLIFVFARRTKSATLCSEQLSLQTRILAAINSTKAD